MYLVFSITPKYLQGTVWRGAMLNCDVMAFQITGNSKTSKLLIAAPLCELIILVTGSPHEGQVM